MIYHLTIYKYVYHIKSNLITITSLCLNFGWVSGVPYPPNISSINTNSSHSTNSVLGDIQRQPNMMLTWR